MGYFGCGVTIILVLNRVCVEQPHVVSSIRKEIVVSLKSMNAAPSVEDESVPN
jgi:sRNA-binding carbon storage regulator CsrA